MDFSTLFSSMPWWFWAVLLLLFILSLARPIFTSAAFKGVMGESAVNDLLKKHLDSDEYHLVENITLYALDGTTQIDHVVVSKYGIFVIETKNMSGWIFGDAKQSKWTQVVYKQKNHFQNPLHQNFKHLKVLETLLGIPNGKMLSIVVFVGDAEFKTLMPANVVRKKELIAYIQSKRAQVINTDEIPGILRKIEIGRLEPGKETDREHKRYIGTYKLDKSQNKETTLGGTALIRLASLIVVVGIGYWLVQKLPEMIRPKEVPVVIAPSSYSPGNYTDRVESQAKSEGSMPIKTQEMNHISPSNPETVELELAQQACNTAIAKALNDQSSGLLEKRDILCRKYKELRGY